MRRSTSSFIFAFLVLACVAAFSMPHAVTADLPAVTKMKLDLQNTGWNNNEKLLEVDMINSQKFGKLFSREVQGFPYGQILYVPAVATKNSGTKNLIFVVTMANVAYAFDADDPNASQPVWQTDLGQDAPSYAGVCMAQIGAVATPVIDIESNSIYITAYHKASGTDFQWRFHALDIRSGEHLYDPQVLSATFVDPANPANVLATFDAKNHIQRAALVLKDGIVWAPFSSYCDLGKYYGWLLGIDVKTGKVARIWNASPVDGEAGIWQSGQGVSFDESGLMVLAVGDGKTSVADLGKGSFGNAIVRIDPNDVGVNNQLKVKDFFVPSNTAFLNQMDLDLGVSGTMVIPGSDNSICGAKEPYLYNINLNELGGYAGTNNPEKVFQRITLDQSQHVHGTPVYWKDAATGKEYLYVWSEADVLKQFEYTRTDNKRIGRLSDSPVHVGSLRLKLGDMPGGYFTVTSNGDKEGSAILWVSRPIGDANKAVTQGVLHAYDARNVSVELWNSEMNAARDKHGAHAKFAPPCAVAGRVYLATFNQGYNQNKSSIACKINAYGLLNYDYTQNPNLKASDPTSSSGSGSYSDGGNIENRAPRLLLGKAITATLALVMAILNVVQYLQ